MGSNLIGSNWVTRWVRSEDARLSEVMDSKVGHCGGFEGDGVESDGVEAGTSRWVRTWLGFELHGFEGKDVDGFELGGFEGEGVDGFEQDGFEEDGFELHGFEPDNDYFSSH